MHVPSQSNLGTISYSTTTWKTKHALRLTINVSGLTATYTDLNFLCPLPGSGETSNATLTGEAEVWGEDPETVAAVGITWHATVA